MPQPRPPAESNDLEDIEALFRRESGRVLATLIGKLGDFDLAEEAVQEAFAVAIERWPREGFPPQPGAWISVTARNKALDRLRRQSRRSRREAELELILQPGDDGPAEEVDVSPIADDRLRLIFTCCHPALAAEARVALTLRTLGGLKTPEIAAAFLVSPATMGQRLSRAKAKIRDARIPYLVPRDADLPDRLSGVLSTIYLIFNEGYAASAGDALVRTDLCQEAIRLCRTLRELMPDEAEVSALLGLMLLHDSRSRARVDAEGRFVLLSDQDRSLWDAEKIEEGLRLVALAWRMAPPRSYALQGAIAAEHARSYRSGLTDWESIARLYDMLLRIDRGPVVALNHAVAVAMAGRVEEGLAMIDALAPQLDGYRLLHASRGELLDRLGRPGEAAAAYERALDLATNEVDRAFLQSRIDDVRGSAKPA